MIFSVAFQVLILVALSGFCFTQVKGFYFKFPSFQESDRPKFIRSPKTNIFSDALQVTPDVTGESIQNRSGRIMYRKQFRLWSKRENKKATFSTTFVARITNRTSPGGEGMAFLLSGNETLPENSEGQWLGIVNSELNGKSEAQVVAVEFDTRKSFGEDVNGNHVGLDINSIYSINQAPLSTVDIDSGKDMRVTVQYDGSNLIVFVGNDTDIPVISHPLNLSDFLPEKVYVGFSGSTGNFTQLNCVRSWEFNGSEIEDDPNLLWVWIVVPVGLVLLICCGAFVLYWKRKYGNQEEEDAYPDIEQAIRGSSNAPRKFHLKQLRKATGKFNSKNKLGKGGFGTVYKGTLGSREVAVKRVSKKSTQGKQEFIAEVTTIGNLHHRNLVKLIGWCYERREYLLVYEYLPNGSLDKFIFSDPSSGHQESALGWATRLNIISGVAQALDYLHNGCEKTVLHRDIKASNIMLDLEFSPRLGDFGLARTIKHSEQTHHSTKELAGTPGYMAPECILTGRATVETDVYAFGVLILEVACGRKPGSPSGQNDYSSFIVNWLWELHRNGKILDSADPRLKGDFERGDMECVLILGLACCHPNPNKRPSMKTALQVLSGEAPPPIVPAERPAFTWPPLPPSFRDLDYSLNGTQHQLSPFSEISGR